MDILAIFFRTGVLDGGGGGGRGEPECRFACFIGLWCMMDDETFYSVVR